MIPSYGTRLSDNPGLAPSLCCRNTLTVGVATVCVLVDSDPLRTRQQVRSLVEVKLVSRAAARVLCHMHGQGLLSTIITYPAVARYVGSSEQHHREAPQANSGGPRRAVSRTLRDAGAPDKILSVIGVVAVAVGVMSRLCRNSSLYSSWTGAGPCPQSCFATSLLPP